MEKGKLHFKFNAPLNTFDSDESTFGCRANNPEICKNNSVDGVCAFSREDGICKRPSKAWKKQFYKLKIRDEGVK